jgi:peptide/nickel transport system permease protein
MKRSRRLDILIVVLAAVHLVVLFAGFVAPYNYASQDREHPYARPTRVHFVDCSGRVHARPFIYVSRLRDGTLNQYEQDCAQVAPVNLFVRGEEYSLAGVFTSSLHLFGVPSPARLYLLGTDGFGRDQFSRVLYGGQVSLFAGLLAAALSLVFGLTIGAIAGTFRGWVDETAMRVAEVFMAVPWVYLLLAVRAILPLQINEALAFVLVVGVIGVVNWGPPARLVRGIILSGRELNFVQAARGFGGSQFYILKRHLLPLTFSVALTQMTILVPRFILAEVLLSFLGLGMGEPFPSWGNMLAAAQQYHVLTSYWWMLLPALVPVPVILAYHQLADALKRTLQSKVRLQGEK